MSIKSERAKHSNRERRSSEESESSYGSSRGSSRATSEDSYLSDRDSKANNTTNKQGVQQNAKSKMPKKVKPLIRGQRDLIRNGRGDGNVTTKMLSENKIKMSEMRNKNIELADLISKYEIENRDLMRIIRKQEKLLKKFQEQENSMPSLMQRQSAESHALQEQLRNLRKKLKNQEEKLKSAEEELEQKQRLLKKMKSLVDDHQLKQRDELRQKLREVEHELKGKSDIVKNLERHIDNLNKNHKHELGLKRAKQYTTSEELNAVRGELQRMQSQLQEKEKELAVLNIYAQQRFQTKPPHRLPSSIISTPVFDRIETHNIKNKGRNNSLNESKFIDSLPHAEIFGDKPIESNLKKNSNNFNGNKVTPHSKINQLNDNNKSKDKDDIDKKIEEIERKAKIKVKQDKQIRMPQVASDKSETDLNMSKIAPETKNNQKQREMLLARMKEIDESHATTKKPSKEPVFSDDLDDLTFSSYQPSFGDSTRTGHNKTKKKAEIISGLFDDDLENFRKEGGNDKGRSNSPILLNFSNDGKKSQFQSSNKSNLLPLRMKQQVSSLATLNGIDSDEEIKELK